MWAPLMLRCSECSCPCDFDRSCLHKIIITFFIGKMHIPVWKWNVCRILVWHNCSFCWFVYCGMKFGTIASVTYIHIMFVLREMFSDGAGSSEGWRPSCLCISCYISCHLAHGTFNPQLSAEGRMERNNGCFYTLASKRQLACISRHIGSVLIRGWRALGTCTPPRLGGQTAPSIPHYKVICPKMLLVSLSFHLSHLTRKWRGSPRCSLL